MTVFVVVAAGVGLTVSEPPEQTVRIDQANLDLAAAVAAHEQATQRWMDGLREQQALDAEAKQVAQVRELAANRFHQAAMIAGVDSTTAQLTNAAGATASTDEIAEFRDTYEQLRWRAERIYRAHERQVERQEDTRLHHGQAVRIAARAEQHVQQVRSYVEHTSRPQLALEQVRTLANPPDPHPDPPLAWPVNGVVVSGYGLRAWPEFGIVHPGIDIVNMPGLPIGAAADGVVVSVRRHPQQGNAVVIDHGEQVQHPGRWSTVYGHLNEIAVTRGQEVSVGDEIGTLGNSGSMTTGPHLHFEVRIENQPVDPRRWLPASPRTEP